MGRMERNNSQGSGTTTTLKEKVYSGMYFRNNDGVYSIYTPKNRCVAQVLMPGDQQLIQDGVALTEICRVLSVRWKVQKGDLKPTADCAGLIYRQIAVSAYELYVPVNGGMKVALIETPADGVYVLDARVLGGICRVLAKRYGI